MARSLLGVDLGTTHTVLARGEPGSAAPPEVVPVPQLVGPGAIEARPLLPSVLFAPPSGESVEDPFGDAPFVVGAWARRRAAELPARAVLSPKSWLAHAGVDRMAPILPWGADEAGGPRISPVEASRRILGHLRRATASVVDWGAAGTIVLAVPASFDAVARELTERAAREAGLEVRLLEEPVAALHALLAERGEEALAPLFDRGDEGLVLVCDVGGGTTDLTLVRADRAGASLALDRVAVGRHLLLGGDNVDLALAHLVEPRLVGEGERLDATRFTELLLACRDAKERLLSADPPPSLPLRLASRGSSLVGGTLATELRLDETRALATDGFFPRVSRGRRPETGRGALVGFGLPYERDPAITHHLAGFLERHAAAGTPRAVLLNGGVFRSPLLRARLLEVLADLVGAEVRELPGADPDLAVARGAVAYARSLEGQGLRIGGGSARGYYVGVAPEGGRRRAILVVPRGAREGERHRTALPGLSLTVGQPVRFPLFAAEAREDAPGAVVDVDASLEELPAVTARFPDASAPLSSRRRGRGDPERRVAVALEGELSALGTLDLACVAGEGDDARLRLAFDLRPAEATRDEPPPAASLGPAPPPSLRPPPSRAPDARLDRARALVEAAFPEPGSPEAGDARHLLRDLEALLGPRASWTLETARGLFDALAPRARTRRRSPEQERVFWLLAGYCLRPGFGHPLDERRVARLAALLPELLAFPDEPRGYQQFFIAWRRVAGGLGEATQVQLRDLLDPFLSTDPDKPKKKKGFAPLAREELLELASALERVPAARRADLGRWVLERTWTSRDPRLWAAIGRIGARVPVAASAHHVVSPAVASTWVEHLLRERWGEVPAAARAATELARATGDRVRDLPERQRREVATRLAAEGAPEAWVRAVLEPLPLEDDDRHAFLGDSLPVGLSLSG